MSLVPESKVSSEMTTKSELELICERITEANQRNSPLLRLPAELRNQIYELVLASEWSVKVTRLGFPQRFDDLQPSSLALLSVCRQTHTEAALLPYSLNTLDFCHTCVATEFQDLFTPAQLHNIRSVVLITFLGGNMQVEDDGMSSELDFLARFTGLKKIVVIEDDMDMLTDLKQFEDKLRGYVPELSLKGG